MRLKTTHLLIFIFILILADIYVLKWASPTVKELFGFFFTNRYRVENVFSDFNEAVEIRSDSKLENEYFYKRCVSIIGEVTDTVVINGWIKVAGKVNEKVCTDWYDPVHHLAIKKAPHVTGELKIESVYYY